jgi:hypothetical protein
VHRHAYSTTGYYETPHPESSAKREADRWKGLQALKSRY